MPLGRMLLDQNVIDPQQLEEARQHRKRAGGSLIDSLVALDLASNEELDELLDEAPQAPETIEETGLDEQFLLQFVLKSVLMTGLETSPRLADYTHLPAPVVETILEIAKEKRLMEVLGMTSGHPSVYRYALTTAGAPCRSRWPASRSRSSSSRSPAITSIIGPSPRRSPTWCSRTGWSSASARP
jgi:hypothetical protein